MTAVLDIANRALQLVGTRTNMTQAEFTGNLSNEAIQTNLIIVKLRDELNRMAPWDCVTKWANLTYITSVPTTPENSSAQPPLWQPGTPAPPWAYEYQYPVDCLRARMIIPQYTSAQGGVPIYPPGTSTGSSGVGWTGPALKFKVATDSFFAVSSAVPAGVGTGYNVGDIVSLQQPVYTFTQFYPPALNQPSQQFTMNVGAPVLVQVTGVNGTGGITSCTVLNQVSGETTSPSGGPTSILGGSYYAPVPNPQTAGYPVTGSGSGETFTLTFTTSPSPQRVILCNQEQAVLCYNAQITDPNVMDDLFQDAWIHLLAARLCFQLDGDKAKANMLITAVNNTIVEARKVDGNEGLTVNDVTPDFLRIRGNWGGPNWEYSPNMSYDWGSFYSPY